MESTPDNSKLTIKQIKDKLDKKGIKYKNNMKKQELLNLLFIEKKTNKNDDEIEKRIAEEILKLSQLTQKIDVLEMSTKPEYLSLNKILLDLQALKQTSQKQKAAEKKVKSPQKKGKEELKPSEKKAKSPQKKVKSPEKKQENKIGFTGVRDMDILILKNLSDEDLKNMCQVDKYMHGLCNEDFFKQLGKERYGDKFLNKNAKNSTWKQWYYFYKNKKDIAIFIVPSGYHKFTLNPNIKQIEVRDYSTVGLYTPNAFKIDSIYLNKTPGNNIYWWHKTREEDRTGKPISPIFVTLKDSNEWLKKNVKPKARNNFILTRATLYHPTIFDL